MESETKKASQKCAECGIKDVKSPFKLCFSCNTKRKIDWEPCKKCNVVKVIPGYHYCYNCNMQNKVEHIILMGDLTVKGENTYVCDKCTGWKSNSKFKLCYNCHLDE